MLALGFDRATRRASRSLARQPAAGAGAEESLALLAVGHEGPDRAREFPLQRLLEPPAVPLVEAARRMIVPETFESDRAMASASASKAPRPCPMAPARGRACRDAPRGPDGSRGCGLPAPPSLSVGHSLPKRATKKARHAAPDRPRPGCSGRPRGSSPRPRPRAPRHRPPALRGSSPFAPEPGSSRSRRTSPSRLRLKERIRIASPENTALQGDSIRKLRPSASMVPSEGDGGCVPRPRNESDASTRIAPRGAGSSARSRRSRGSAGYAAG